MAETYLLNKLKSVEQTFNELNRRLADPDIATDPGVSTSSEVSLFTEEVVILMKLGNHPRRTSGARQCLRKQQVIQSCKRWQRWRWKNWRQTRAARDPLEGLLYLAIRTMTKNIMLEIRAGTGGDEASIWGGFGPMYRAMPKPKTGRCW